MAPASRNLSAAKFSTTTNHIHHAVIFDEIEFAVESHDIPRFASMLLTKDFILDLAKKEMLDDIGARELTSRGATPTSAA